jgi:hypothetical protein
MSSIAYPRKIRAQISSIDVLVYGFLAVSAFAYVFITYRADLLIEMRHAGFSNFFFTHLSILIPEIVIWVIAAIGALRLKAYARSAGRSRDGVAFNYIADAVLLLIVYSVAISLATNVKLLFVHSSPSVLKVATLLTVHIPVMMVLLSSVFLFIGAYELNRMASAGLRRLSPWVVELSLAIFVLLVSAYLWYFSIHAPSRVDDDSLSHFAVPVSTLLMTYVLPHIITWLLSLLAFIHLLHYARYVRGSIYRTFLRNLYVGVLLVFGCTYIVQVLYVSNISSRHFSPALLLVFGVLIALMAGYLLIYRGASRLRLLEGSVAH